MDSLVCNRHLWFCLPSTLLSSGYETSSSPHANHIPLQTLPLWLNLVGRKMSKRLKLGRVMNLEPERTWASPRQVTEALN